MRLATESAPAHLNQLSLATRAACAKERTPRMFEAEQHGVGNDFALAYALLRLTLGINIALHGISRIVAGPAAFVATLSKQFASTPLPHFAVQGFGYALPWLEAAIGLLVLFGAFTRAALIAGALLIALLTFGSSLHQDWDVVGLQLIYALVYFVLISLRKYNTFSVDGLLLRERG